jgi:hypothetical protein
MTVNTEPDRVMVKKVTLLALQEKLDLKTKEMGELEKDDKVRRYLELKNGLVFLTQAVKDAEVQVARASVGADKVGQTWPDKLPRPGRSETSRKAIWGDILEKVHLSGKLALNVYHRPYSSMLSEFRGRVVAKSKVDRWMKKEFGLSHTSTTAYIKFGVQRGTVVSKKDGNGIELNFPKRYEAGVLTLDESQTNVTPEEMRKAGLMK